MAIILDQSAVCDGFDVRCMLASGERLAFHFSSAPADVQAAADAWEVRYLAVVGVGEEVLEIVEE